jgi:hypothetical protein
MLVQNRSDGAVKTSRVVHGMLNMVDVSTLLDSVRPQICISTDFKREREVEVRPVHISQDNLPKAQTDQCVKVLWTGGWDSSFRVLYLALVARKRIEPHYIIDANRLSSLCELHAIAEIKAILGTSHPEAAGRIGSLQIASRHEIPEDLVISKSWEGLRQQAPLGRQYDWLARYAKWRNLTDLELSVHVDDKAHYFLKGRVEQTPLGAYRLRPGVIGDGELFTRFEFPILEYSKTQMRDLARNHGFIEILEKSWFCHQPKNGVPCGTCSPCIYTIKEGMAYRLPTKSMFRYHMSRCRKVLHSPWLLRKVMLSKIRGSSE